MWYNWRKSKKSGNKLPKKEDKFFSLFLPAFQPLPPIFAANFGTGMARRCIKSLLVATFSLCMVLFSNAIHAQHEAAATDTAAAAGHEKTNEGEFNVTETILEHIKDDHSWHLWGHTTLPLPVILYSDKGLEIFSSAKLMDEHHEPATRHQHFGLIALVRVQVANKSFDTMSRICSFSSDRRMNVEVSVDERSGEIGTLNNITGLV